MSESQEVAIGDDQHNGFASDIGALCEIYRVKTGQAGRVANLRLLSFVFLIAATLALFEKWTNNRVALSIAFLFAIAFAHLVRRSAKLKPQLQFLRESIALGRESQHRVARDWKYLSHRSWESASSTHPYANDLDIFGIASVAQLLSPVSATPGRAILRSWLSHAATRDEVKRRQEAVRELTQRIAFRNALAVYGARIRIREDQLVALQEWAKGEISIRATRTLRWIAVLVPATTLGAGIGQALGYLDHPLWIVPIVAGVLASTFWKTGLKSALGPVEGFAVALEAYADMLHVILSEQFPAQLLAELQARFTDGGLSVLPAMRRLRTLSRCAEVRSSPLLHFVLQTITLWDFQLVFLLERWQRTAGARVDVWMDALGRIESLASLAAVAHDNPDWSFPRISEDYTCALEARGLGHPLLRRDKCVRNDVIVGPSGTVLVITGSNMAGKSTLLRAIGVNVVLAQAGSAVCAVDISLPPLSLYTSMRVQDSLESGVSYFMAELNRLKLILDAVRDQGARSKFEVLYLIDEILQGTNSAERTIAARQILSRLIDSCAVGAVTTHDLELFNTAGLAAAARHVHLKESFTERGVSSMYFDYRLRPGIADTSNALKLLDLVGVSMTGPSMLAAEERLH